MNKETFHLKQMYFTENILIWFASHAVASDAAVKESLP